MLAKVFAIRDVTEKKFNDLAYLDDMVEMVVEQRYHPCSMSSFH